MSLVTESNPLTHEQEVLKQAFARGIQYVGGGKRMAAVCGVSEGQVSRWKHPQYNEHVPAHLYRAIDAAAGYPCMTEALALLGGFSIRREEVERADMPLCVLAGIVAEDSGRAVRAVLEANADQSITLRELNCIEAEGKTAVANVNRMIEAARALHESGQGGSVVRMTGGTR